MSLEDAGGRTFSDAWYRVAGVRAHLRTSVTAQRQFFRGEPWVVLRDKFSNEWFRVSPDAYAFLSRLGDGLTVDEAWNRSLGVDARMALTQEEVVQLLGQLNLSNLLQYDRGDSQVSQYQRFKKRKSREWRGLLMGFMSIKIPLFDPDRLLTRWLPLIRTLYGPLGLSLYLALLFMGAKAVMDESDRLFDQSASLLAPANLGLLYLGFLLCGWAIERFGVELTQGLTRLGRGLGVDQIGDGLGLGQVHTPILEGPTRELARFGRAEPQRQQGL